MERVIIVFNNYVNTLFQDLTLPDNIYSSYNIILDTSKLKQYGINLQEHQLEFINILQQIFSNKIFKHHGIILGDDVGLGKTITSISSVLLMYEYFKSINKPHTILYVTLKNIKYDILTEIKKYNIYKHINTIVINNKKELYTAISQIQKYNFIILHYDVFQIKQTTTKEEIELIANFLNIIKRDNPYISIIMDEAQKIKNYKSSISQVIKQINQYFDETFTIVTTATPMENNLLEFFNLLQSIFVDIDLTPIINKYVEIETNNGVYVKYKYNNLDDLKEKLQTSHIVVRRTKKDIVNNISDKLYIQNVTEFNINVGIDELQVNLLNALKQDVENIAHPMIKNIIRFLYMREIFNNPIIIKYSQTESEYLNEVKKYIDMYSDKYWKTYKSPKDKKILNIIEQYPTSKIIVFSFYETVIQHLYEILQPYNIPNLYMFTGSVRTNRNVLKGKTQYVILATDVLSTGINIELDILVNYDLLFNPAKMQQRNGRIYRLRHKKSPSQQNKDGKIINLLSTFDKYIFNNIISEKIEVFDYLFTMDKIDSYNIKKIQDIYMFDLQKFFDQLNIDEVLRDGDGL